MIRKVSHIQQSGGLWHAHIHSHKKVFQYNFVLSAVSRKGVSTFGIGDKERNQEGLMGHTAQ